MKQKIKSFLRFSLIKTLGPNRITNWFMDLMPVDAKLKVLDEGFGHSRSKQLLSSVDTDGKPLPWFTYGAINYLDSLDLSEMTVLEWGSGNSSLYFASKAKKVISIENDINWYNSVVTSGHNNNQVILCDDADYAKTPLQFGRNFDLIIIDGMDRFNCSLNVLDLLKDGGIVILDNSDWFKNTAAVLRDMSLIQVDFAGFGPINDYPWVTSLFLSRNCNLKTSKGYQPLNPPGGIQNVCD